jgi:hypothetical protein
MGFVPTRLGIVPETGNQGAEDPEPWQGADQHISLRPRFLAPLSCPDSGRAGARPLSFPEHPTKYSSRHRFKRRDKGCFAEALLAVPESVTGSPCGRYWLLSTRVEAFRCLVTKVCRNRSDRRPIYPRPRHRAVTEHRHLSINSTCWSCSASKDLAAVRSAMRRSR